MPNAKKRKNQKAQKLKAATQHLSLTDSPIAAPIKKINMSVLNVVVHGKRVWTTSNDESLTVYDCGEALACTSVPFFQHHWTAGRHWWFKASPTDSRFIAHSEEQAYILNGQNSWELLSDVCRDILFLTCYTLRNPSSLVSIDQDWNFRLYDLGPDAKFENARLVSERNFFLDDNDDENFEAKSMSSQTFMQLTNVWKSMPPPATSIHYPTPNQIVVTTQSDVAIKTLNVQSKGLNWHSFAVPRPRPHFQERERLSDKPGWTEPNNVQVATATDKKNDFVTCVSYLPSMQETTLGMHEHVHRHRFSLWQDKKKTKTTGVIFTPTLNSSRRMAPSSVMRKERLFALPDHKSLVFSQDLKDVNNSQSLSSSHLIDVKDLKNYPLKIDQLQDMHGVLSDGRLVCSDIYGELFVLDFANISLDRQHLKTVESKDAKAPQTASRFFVRADDNLICARDNYLLRAMYNINLLIDLGHMILSYAPGKIFLASTSRNTLFKSISNDAKGDQKSHIHQSVLPIITHK